MQAGAWQVRLAVDGARGHGELAVPVPALPARTRTMQTALGARPRRPALASWPFGAVSIAGAGARDALAGAGRAPSPESRRRGRRARMTAAVVRRASRSSAATPGGTPRRPTTRATSTSRSALARARRRRRARAAARRSGLAALAPRSTISCPITATSCTCSSCASRRSTACGTCIRRRAARGAFRFTLPAMEAGRYRLYADVVHATGLAETAVADARVRRPRRRAARPATTRPAAARRRSIRRAPCAPLDGGARMVWLRDEAPTRARKAGWFRFRVEDGAGAAQPLEPYMGMLGHAAFVGARRQHLRPRAPVGLGADGRARRARGRAGGSARRCTRWRSAPPRSPSPTASRAPATTASSCRSNAPAASRPASSTRTPSSYERLNILRDALRHGDVGGSRRKQRPRKPETRSSQLLLAEARLRNLRSAKFRRLTANPLPLTSPDSPTSR